MDSHQKSDAAQERAVEDWTSLRDLIDSQYGDELSHSNFIFRGECQPFKHVWPLIDRLMLQERTPQDVRLMAECDAMRQFDEAAALHLSRPVVSMLDVSSGLSTQILMRHYGAPTRLLDWTYSPWIALYHACSQSPDTPGRVFGFDRLQLARQLIEKYEDETKSHNRPMTDHGKLFGLPGLFDSKYVESIHDWVCCYYPGGRKFPRLLAQQGLFTFASKPWLDHIGVLSALIPDGVSCITIPRDLKGEILRRLRHMGIDGATMFPDIEGVCCSIREHISRRWGHP